MDIDSKILRTINGSPNAVLEGVRYDSKSNSIKVGKFMEKFIRSITFQ